MEEKPSTRRALLCKLFFSMLKIGLFTFGGGYAMLALFESEFADRKKWIDKDEFIDMVAIAESTPGPLAINGSVPPSRSAFPPLPSSISSRCSSTAFSA